MLYYENYCDIVSDLDFESMTLAEFLDSHEWAKINLGIDLDPVPETTYPVLKKNGAEALCHSEGLLYCPGDGSNDRWSDDPEDYLDEFGITLTIPADMIGIKSIEYNERDQKTVFELENGTTLIMNWQGYISSTDSCEYEEIQRKNPDGTLEAIGFVPTAQTTRRSW